MKISIFIGLAFAKSVLGQLNQEPKAWSEQVSALLFFC